MLRACALGCGDQEHQIGRAVGRTEVDRGPQPREPDRGVLDRRGPAVRDRDPAGQTGRGLRLPVQCGALQCPRVTGAPGGSQQAGQSLDDGLLIGAGIDIQQHQIGADDREVRHGVTFGLGLGRP